MQMGMRVVDSFGHAIIIRVLLAMSTLFIGFKSHPTDERITVVRG